ncbi:lamin tail domain-containing protein [Paenibacillus sp.]|uniref:lamin tail domain-containing protein n=1 Tax=Paenibacillus sp. TaxID=58172 RepID=UPI002D39725F|nr:lamin tail domain-containing protein [Paenibacillus sp.]HZG83557.1 lamin tail domain-containing protein [Paenibacillus sp.]
MRATKRWIASVLAAAMLAGAALPAGVGKVEAAGGPELFVSEIHPNIVGAEDHEFFEVYNNTDQPIELGDYEFIYHYPSNPTSDKTFTFVPKTLAPKQAMVFWYNKAGLTLQDFNAEHGSSVTAEQVIEIGGFDGFSNSGDRGVIIKNNQGEVVSTSSYTGTDAGEGKGIHFKLPESGTAASKLRTQAAPTPGVVEPDQLPAVSGKPNIQHTPVNEGKAADGLAIEADIAVTDAVYSVTAAVYHKPASASEFAWIPMNAQGGSSYAAHIPSGELTEAQHQYYIEAAHGDTVERTATYNVAIQTDDFDFGQVPEVLITELVPDSSNVSSADAYEFIEIYNNTDETIDLRDYKIIYRFTNSVSETDWTWESPLAELPLPSKQSMVLWVLNGVNKTMPIEQFNANYGVSLQENVNLVRIDGGGGMANSGKRKIVVATVDGTEVSEAYYDNDDQTQANKGIFYRYPIDGSNQMVMTSAGIDAATPGAVTSEQVPQTTSGAAPVVNHPPKIAHTPVTEGKTDEPVAIEADITNKEQAAGNDEVTAKLYFKKASESSYSSVPMAKGEGDRYAASIPTSALAESSAQYYIEAADAKSTVRTEAYTINVKAPDFDYARVSPLLVTELVPDSTNVGSADGYEFIEVYNNTNEPINLEHYKIVYRYTDSGPEADVVWPTDREDLIIPPKDTLVFWVINGANDASTVADFNANYGVSLVEGEDIVRIYSGGMANGGKRGVLVATNTGFELSAAYYDTDAETVADKGIFYKYPLDGGTTMIKTSAGVLAATPGSVEEEQVPPVPASLPNDTTPPTFKNETGVSEVHQSANLDLIAAVRDDHQVKTVALYYKTDAQDEFTKRYLKENFDDTFYHYMIYSPELIGRKYVDYYYEYSDGVHRATTETFRVNVTGGRDTSDLRLNVKNGDVLAGTRIVRGTAEHAPADELTLSIDEQPIDAGAYKALENDAYFAFEATGVNFYFKNGVVMGTDILRIFDDTINSWTTITVPIDADRLQSGVNAIAIRAGSKASPFDDRPEENKDDFDVRNVRLVLADGTEIYDPRSEFASKETAIKMGDSANKHPVVEFQFAIPADKLASKAYAWNTKQAADGAHVVTVAHPQYGEASASVIVDNTPPAIEPSIASGATMRGPFTIAADVTDALAGVGAVTATLDGRAIELPYATSSAALAGGDHVLRLKATDKVGNAAETEVVFYVPDELPAKPELVGPAHGGEAATTTSLTVKVLDPTQDPMNVSFWRGFKYFAGVRDAFVGFLNAVDREPPREAAPEGEQSFADADYAKIAAKDGDYLVNDAVDRFPYQRFEVTLDPSVAADDPVHVSWTGHSIEGRKVTLYAWDPAAQQWNALDSRVAGSEDFELAAEIRAGDYADGRTVRLMVQDEVPPTPDEYDYSFVWMSDTQYYSESYPHIYSDIVDWIAEKKDEMKIKYVTHTGDLVDEADKPEQWAVASENMKVLEEAGIPYGVLAGNHDVYGKEAAYDEYWKYFGEDRFASQDTYGGSYDNNRGHYDLVSSHGNDYIFLYMGWGIGDEEIAWMDQVLKQYPDRMAVLNFHEYLLVSGNRAPIADKIHEQVVVPNPNVVAVLSGHYHDAELLVDEIDDNGDGTPDRNVYQMLADYQGGPEGGQGYIRLMQFDIDNNKLHIKTYSPYLDDYNFYDPEQHPGKDEFSLDLDLTPRLKRVATDYIEVNVYAKQKLGEKTGAASGSNVSFDWSDLVLGSTYEWYAVAEDVYGARTLSDIWKFTVTKAAEAVNLSPVWEAIPPQKVVLGDTLSFQVKATDPEGGEVAYSAAKLPEGATFDPTTRTFAWTPETAGTFEAVFAAADDRGAKTELKVVIEAVADLAPVWDAAKDVRVYVGTAVSFQVKATDPEGGIIAYSAAKLPDGATFDPVTRTFAWTPLASGNYEAVFAAADGRGASSTLTVRLNIVPPPAEPSNPTPSNPTPTEPGTPSAPANPGQPRPSNGGAVTVQPQVEQGVAKAVVDADAVAQAAQQAQQGRIVFRVERTEEANTVEVALPAAQLVQALSETNAARVTIDAGFATVTATREQLERLLGGGAADLELAVASVPPEELPAEAAERIGDRPVYDFEIRVDGEAVSEFGANSGIFVEMNYPLRPGEQPGRIVAYFVNDNGELEPVRMSGYDPQTGTIRFAPRHFSKYTALPADVAFADLEGVEWARDGIESLAAKDIAHGVRPNVFEPQRSITRAEFLKLLMDALELASEAPAGAAPFADVAPTDWHYRYVAAANALGIANGRPDGSFGADDAVTRQEIAALTQRAAAAAGVELRAPQGAAPFADSAEIAPYAADAAAALEAAGIVAGFADGRFAPAEAATRAQAAVMVHRLLTYALSR